MSGRDFLQGTDPSLQAIKARQRAALAVEDAEGRHQIKPQQAGENSEIHD